MKRSEFCKVTGLSRKTAMWLYQNVFHIGCVVDGTHKQFTQKDVEYVLDRQVARYSARHNIKRLEETDDEYYIEDTGKIFSYKRGFLEERKCGVTQGYKFVILWFNGKHNDCRLNRLIAKYFVEKPEGRDVVNHLNGNKMDNNASNLEWTTVSGNTQHAFDHGLAQNAKGEEDSQSIPVDVLDKDGNLIAHYGSMCEASRTMEISKTTVSRLARMGTFSRKYQIYIKCVND